MNHPLRTLSVVFILLCAFLLAGPGAGQAGTLDWKGLTWHYSDIGHDPYVNGSGHLVGSGHMGASNYYTAGMSLAGKDVWIKAEFLSPAWGTNQAIFADGYTEGGSASRLHVGLMGGSGEVYGGRHITHYNSTPHGATHPYQPRAAGDVGLPHSMALHKPADGQTMEMWIDQQLFAIINTTDPGGGDILANLPYITLGSFMPSNRSLPYTFTDFEVVIDGVSSQTPEPATGLLFATAAGVFGLLRRRSRSKEHC